jgi:lipopolysaccharide/colanic/teichoic acid biosynthesis glycosyltransferase
VAALAVALDGGAPFYRQDRIGRGGRLFRLVKIRTMVPGAEALLARHLAACPAARAEWDRTQKLARDPRVTRIGRLLRASSLDELPQLWNVLRGDMSLVGPRPMLPEQRALYPGRAYYALRPGLTGPWQVSARNRSGFADRAGFDQAYHAGLSLAGDLRLIAATVRVVLRRTGC